MKKIKLENSDELASVDDLDYEAVVEAGPWFMGPDGHVYSPTIGRLANFIWSRMTLAEREANNVRRNQRPKLKRRK